MANGEAQVEAASPASALTVLSLSRKVLCVSQAPVRREARADCLHGDSCSQGQHQGPGTPPRVLRLLCGSAGPELESSALHSQPEMPKWNALLLQES